MSVFRNKNSKKIAAPVTRPPEGGGFSIYGVSGGRAVSEEKLYYALRRTVPIIDAAVCKTVRLVGGYTVRCLDSKAQNELDSFISEVPVGGNMRGIWAFTEVFLEQLLTCGTALGEIVTDTDSDPVALFNSPLDNIEFARGENGFDVEIFVREPGGPRKVERPELCLMGVLDPEPGKITGTSLLRGLPFVSEILMQIYKSIGQNWERAGNIRYAVTYNPGNSPGDRSQAASRVNQIAGEWAKAMKSGSGVRDFVAAGDVSIKVIGADSKTLDSNIPVRQLLEQIVAKTGIPPFLLGLSWSTSERMSAQQADVLTSELEAYRRLLTPVIKNICRAYLLSRGYNPGVEVVWDDITLQDEVEQSRARLYNAQAERLGKEKE